MRVAKINVPRQLNPAVDPSIGWELLRHEYSEAALTFRHFSALRFAIMSVYVALTGGIGAIALKLVPAISPDAARFAAAGTVLVTITFFFAECVCERNRQHYFDSMAALELALGYDTVRKHPHWTVVQARYAIGVLYLCSLAFWTNVALQRWLSGA